MNEKIMDSVQRFSRFVLDYFGFEVIDLLQISLVLEKIF
jgi:hypothetical protein